MWDSDKGKWYFSIVDVVEILTDSYHNLRKYWSVLKTRLKKDESQLTINCSQLSKQGVGWTGSLKGNSVMVVRHLIMPVVIPVEFALF